MKTIDVEGQLREETGKSATRQIRAENKIPCVIYGAGENIHFITNPLAVRDLIFTDEFRKANIKVGDNSYEAVIKDIQYHPVTDKILHIDFQQIVSGKAVKTILPIRLIGTAAGQKDGGVLVQKMRQLNVKVKPEGMLAVIAVDISALEMGDSLRVRDIDVDDSIEIMNNESIPIASVDVPRTLRSLKSKEELLEEEAGLLEGEAEATEEA